MTALSCACWGAREVCMSTRTRGIGSSLSLMVGERKATKLAALLEVEPVLASGHELFELAPERFGQLGRRGRQNALQPARFAEADDGGADPPVAKRRLQGRGGKVGVPLLAQVRHAPDGVQCRLAGGAVPIARAGAAPVSYTHLTLPPHREV